MAYGIGIQNETETTKYKKPANCKSDSRAEGSVLECVQFSIFQLNTLCFFNVQLICRQKHKSALNSPPWSWSTAFVLTDFRKLCFLISTKTDDVLQRTKSLKTSCGLQQSYVAYQRSYSRCFVKNIVCESENINVKVYFYMLCKHNILEPWCFRQTDYAIKLR